MIRVFVVDDNPTFLATAALVIEATPDAELVGTASSAEAALDHLEALGPWGRARVDLVLVDHQLPGMTGLDAAAVLAQRCEEAATPRPVIVLMSSYERHELPTASLGWRFVDRFVPKAHLSPATIRSCWSAGAVGEAQAEGGTK